MTWEEYAKIVLGNKKVAELKKEYNLCTKKYTWGRYKGFINRLKKECKLKKQLEDTKNFVKCLYTGGYISEMTKNNILDRLGD